MGDSNGPTTRHIFFRRIRSASFLVWRKFGKYGRGNLKGQSSESQDKEVMPMEQFLLNCLAAIVAGVVVVLISRKMK